MAASSRLTTRTPDFSIRCNSASRSTFSRQLVILRATSSPTPSTCINSVFDAARIACGSPNRSRNARTRIGPTPSTMLRAMYASREVIRASATRETATCLRRHLPAAPLPPELQLRLLQQLIVLQQPENLQQIRFSVIVVGRHARNQFLQNRPKRDHAVDPLRPQPLDAALPCFRIPWQSGHNQDFYQTFAPDQPLRLLDDPFFHKPKNLRLIRQHARREHSRVPPLHRHNRPRDLRQGP